MKKIALIYLSTFSFINAKNSCTSEISKDPIFLWGEHIPLYSKTVALKEGLILTSKEFQIKDMNQTIYFYPTHIERCIPRKSSTPSEKEICLQERESKIDSCKQEKIYQFYQKNKALPDTIKIKSSEKWKLVKMTDLEFRPNHWDSTKSPFVFVNQKDPQIYLWINTPPSYNAKSLTKDFRESSNHFWYDATANYCNRPDSIENWQQLQKAPKGIDCIFDQSLWKYFFYEISRTEVDYVE